MQTVFNLIDLIHFRAFKSFKLKKKSSTLGINKTSESPPELRRVYPLTDTYNTVDSRSRHTYDIGLGNNFQRGGYRSSLQNVHSTGGVSGLVMNSENICFVISVHSSSYQHALKANQFSNFFQFIQTLNRGFLIYFKLMMHSSACVRSQFL